MANKNNKTQSKKGNLIISIGSTVLILALVLASFINKGNNDVKKESSTVTVNAQQGGDVVINKSDITETASFIPYQSGNTKMEIIAVKASDGSIRTAFNTCQVCFDSGRGYYVQQGDELICQNCGNRFKISQVEKEKMGCNPVPILDGDKTDNGQTITIPQSFIDQNAVLFSNWKV